MEWFQELGDESVKTAKNTEVDNDEDVIKANKLTALKRHTAGLDQGPGFQQLVPSLQWGDSTGLPW